MHILTNVPEVINENDRFSVLLDDGRTIWATVYGGVLCVGETTTEMIQYYADICSDTGIYGYVRMSVLTTSN